MPFGKRIRFTGAPTATQYPHHHKQQQGLLKVAHTIAEVSTVDGLENLI
jgi:hypothetical protein